MSDKLGLITSGSVSGNAEALSKAIVERKQTRPTVQYVKNIATQILSYETAMHGLFL